MACFSTIFVPGLSKDFLSFFICDPLLTADNYVALLGDNDFEIDGTVGSVLLAGGHDRLAAHGEVELIRAGRGDDTVTLGGVAEKINMGRGDDTLVVDGYVAYAKGGRGDDILDLGDRNAGDFDIAIDGRSVLLSDRFTGETMEMKSFESFIFADRTFERDALRDTFTDALPAIQVGGGTQTVTVNDPNPTISVLWDRVVQQAVIDTDAVAVGPTVAARAYAMLHTAIYDAWATYDDTAVRISFDQQIGNNETLATIAAAAPVEGAQAKAMSYAAITVLQALFPDQEALIRSVMEDRLGHSMQNDGSVAAAVGIDAAQDLLALRIDDGANQSGNYAAEPDAYTPVNADPDSITDITKWTPEYVPIGSGENLQGFLTPQWGDVESFSLAELADGSTDHADHRPEAPQPFFTDAYADAVLDFETKTITHEGVVMDVDKSLIGTVINPHFIEQAEEVVAFSANLTDEEKTIAEFAEDGGGTAFPPGTFMAFAQFVSARDNHDLDTDAQMFMAMANAMLDASVATWEAKTFYDYVRPVRAIRDLGELGLIGEFDAALDGYVIEAWAGPGLGTQTILATDFITFQRPDTDPSPPFSEYTSGHSGFSAAGAEVLKLFTGSDDFGGSVTFAPGSTQFEEGVPGETVVLDWETFSDAADDAGISRLYGGIHFTEGDQNGRALGRQVGEQAYELAQSFIDGTATDAHRPFYTADGFDLLI